MSVSTTGALSALFALYSLVSLSNCVFVRMDIEYFEMYDTRRGTSLFAEDSIVHGLLDGDSGNPEPPPTFGREMIIGIQYYDTISKVLIVLTSTSLPHFPFS